VTNVIFGFEISPNTNPKRKKWGDTSPVSSTELRPW